VPYQHCDRVKDTNCVDIPRQECIDVPYEDCHDVQRERCVQESFQDCQDYPRQECKFVHQKVPRQTAKQVPIRVCDNGGREQFSGNGQQYSGNGQFDGTSLFDIRREDNIDYDAEEIDLDQTRENIDPGFLQPPIAQTKLEGTNFPKEPDNFQEDDELEFVFGDK
jgi:hypothetical protein